MGRTVTHFSLKFPRLRNMLLGVLVGVLFYPGNAGPDRAASASPESPAYPTPKAVIPLLQFQGAPLVSAFRILSSYSPMEILPSSTVKDSITLSLENRTWKQALDTICLMAGLVPVRQKGYWFVLPGNELTDDMRAMMDSSQIREESEVQNREIRLAHRSALEARKHVSSMLSDRGKVEIHRTDGVLRIRDVPDSLRRIEAWIRAFDRPLPRARIEMELLRLEKQAISQMGPFPIVVKALPDTTPRFNALQPKSNGADAASEFLRLLRVESESAFARMRQEWENRGWAKPMANSVLHVEESKTGSAVLSSQVPVRTRAHDGSEETQVLHPGFEVSVCPTTVGEDLTWMTLNLERRTYLIDPAVGIVPRRLSGSCELDFSVGSVVLIGSVSENEPALILALSTRTVGQ